MIRSLAISAAAFAAALFFSHRIAELPPAPSGGDPIRLPAEALRVASAGYEAVLSDWYWLLAIQYFGTRSNEADDFRELPAYLEAATDLDPDFGYVYAFGGEVVPFRRTGEKKFHNTEATLHLLKKGMASHSDRWDIPYLLAYTLYTYRGDYLTAGQYMKEAALRPRAPAYLNSFAPLLLAQGGSVDTALAFTENALARASAHCDTDHWTCDDLKDRIVALRLQKALDQLNAAAKASAAAGKPAQQVADLIGYAGLDRIPEEPYGGSFRLAGGKVVSDHDDKLLHTFVHPGSPPTEPYVD